MRASNPLSLFRALLVLIIALQPNCGFAQAQDSLSWTSLKRLSLEELMNVEVTSVSKHAEKLKEAASAIQVITQADILSSGAKTLPEALRLASNLQVAQVNSSQWAISARGFNNVLANKLLVLIDGRAVYTPLYAGVFWDVQNVLLADVDRIEVISGPGGTLWGANAVNGVINIITKNSAETKGLFAEAAFGSNLPGLGSIRYGGRLSRKLSYRVYGTGFKLGNTFFTDSTKANDHWTMGLGGFRLDWDASGKDKVTFQGNLYHGRPNPNGQDTAAITQGDNVMVQWNHISSPKSDFQLKAYYDYTWRDFGNSFSEGLKTFDIAWQNRYQLGQRHELTYGLDFRQMDDKVNNIPQFAFLPGNKTLYLYSLFIQDKITLIRERLRFTIGSKMEHNSYTGFEHQPNARLAWTPGKSQTVWAAVSHAVRTPGRIDRDFYLYRVPDLAIISGNENFVSEKMTAYELGWRSQPLKTLSLSLATFYNVYDNIRSAEPGPPPYNIPITFGNGVKGETYGMELSVTSQLAGWWTIKAGYTLLKKSLWVKSGSKDMNGASAESDDPENQVVIQSNIKLPGHFELGTVFRYVDQLPKPYVPEYTVLDVRVGYNVSKSLALNIVAQNLLDKRHPEFIPSSPGGREIERSIYGKLTFFF